ncbi:MAG: RidA family protein [Nitrospinota bacterium]|nr:RidA family protein [Nitrospinota bacterium]MDP6618730.1 RidA family protein [Nitrospinota bacterium]
MAKDIEHIHWKGADTSKWMPYAPVIKVNRGKIVFIAGCTSAPMYHSHPHIPEEFDNMPTDLGGQTRAALEGMKKGLDAVGATFDDVVECTRFVTDLSRQDAMNEVWAEYFTGSKPTTVTVEVVKLATDSRCMVEISAIAVVDDET